jgi:hypothetical protein
MTNLRRQRRFRDPTGSHAARTWIRPRNRHGTGAVDKQNPKQPENKDAAMIFGTSAAERRQRAADPGREPSPSGRLPGEQPTTPNPRPDGQPNQGPSGPRAPHPVDEPDIQDPSGPGSEPDHLPSAPGNPNTHY